MSKALAAAAHRFLHLSHKVVVITGGAGGIGLELGREALKRGATVALVDLDESRLREAARHLGAAERVSVHTADLTQEAAVKQVVQDIVAQHGRLDVLINNAGVSLAGRFADCTLEDFDWVQRVNVKATVMLTHHVLPHLHTGAQIVNVSSMAGLVGMPASTAYSASKFAVRGFSDSLRTELIWKGIGVTVVHPGGINTGLKERLRYGAKVSEQEQEALANAGAKSMRTTSPQKAARLILDGAQRRRARVVIGPDAKALDLLGRLFPASLWKILSQATKQ